MYPDEELATFGFNPYHLGEPVDAAVIQADHSENQTLTPADLPGTRTLADGRCASIFDYKIGMLEGARGVLDGQKVFVLGAAHHSALVAGTWHN